MTQMFVGNLNKENVACADEKTPCLTNTCSTMYQYTCKISLEITSHQQRFINDRKYIN